MRSTVSVYLFILLSEVWIPPCFVDGVGFRFFCAVDRDVTAIREDPETGIFVPVGNRQLRHLRSIPANVTDSLFEQDVNIDEGWMDWSSDEIQWKPGYLVTEKGNNNKNATISRRLDEEEHLVRRCSCRRWRSSENDVVYCPLTTSHCGTYRKPELHDLPLGCLTPAKNETLNSILFLIIFVWLMIVLCCLFTSRRGIELMNYCLNKCFPRYNSYVANRMLRRNPDLAREMIRTHVALRRQIMERRLDAVAPGLVMGDDNDGRDNERRRPTSLALKTTIFRKDGDDNGGEGTSHSENYKFTVEEDDDYDSSCIICFQPLEDGDRVGMLTCKHILHAECLKSWLKRRNVCPLCNARDAATPRFQETNIGTTTGHGDSSNNTNVRNENSNGNTSLSSTSNVETHGNSTTSTTP